MKNCFLACLVFSAACQPAADTKNGDWPVYNGSPENRKFSDLREVDTSNVQSLQVAWTFSTGDADTVNRSQIQCNPLIIDGILYGTSPQGKLFALDAASGKKLWLFNPVDSLTGDRSAYFNLNNIRGLAYWTDGKSDRRIFYTCGTDLICINAADGKPVVQFGNKGRIDLHYGLDREVHDLFITNTSPGVVFENLLIIGSRVDEGPAAAPGHIRAYDVMTGRLQWIFHTIPHPGEFGYDTWDDSLAYIHIGGANAWSGLSLDSKRGIVYAPLGSASFDFYGGKRTGQNLFANSLVALDARTGKRKWHFQTVHHDVWDMDLSSPPVLVTVNRNGKNIDAVAQPTKTGFVFVFDRETGEPLFPVDEVPVNTSSTLEGEKLWATQPIPRLPEPFVRQGFDSADINDLAPDSSQQDIRMRWSMYEKGKLFHPLGKRGTILFPGLDGGGEWGGAAFDPSSGNLIINANEFPWVLTMIGVNEKKLQHENYAQAGMRLYNRHCLNCHGADRKGTGNYPSLFEIEKKYEDSMLSNLLLSGRRMMPSFAHLADEERNAIRAFVLNNRQQQLRSFQPPKKMADAYRNLKYNITGYNTFSTKEGYPAVKPPWGTLNAIDLNTGKISWKVPLGEYPEFEKKGIHTGTINYGGPVVTAGGLVFIAATSDARLRAFHKRTGRLLWQYQLPFAGFATPAVYSVRGKQYVVLACGGGKLNTISGDVYIAFALP